MFLTHYSSSKIFLSLLLGLGAISASELTAGNYTIPVTGLDTLPQGRFSDASGCLVPPSLTTTSLTFDSQVSAISSYAFHNCNGITSLTLPDDLCSIGYFAFSNCKNLESPIYNKTVFARLPVTSETCNIPEGITTITSAACRECSALTGVVIPSSVTKIEESAFALCSSLTSVTLPSQLQEIGDCAFWSCSKLREIHVEAQTPPVIGSDTFKKINSYCILFVPAGTKQAYQSATNWKSFKYIVETSNQPTHTLTTVSGDYSATKAFESLNLALQNLDKATAHIIDVTGVTKIPSGKTFSTGNSNALIKASSGLNIGNTPNVIVNNVCKQLMLTDKLPFHVEEAFTANSATYSRDMQTAWGTLCLPFAIASNENVQLYQLDVQDMKNNVLFFCQVERVAANTPCVIKRKGAVSFSATNIVLENTPALAEISIDNSWSEQGAYSEQKITASETAGSIYYIQKDTFYRNVKTVTVPSFRGWFIYQGTNNAPDRLSINSATGIDEVSADMESGSLYNLAGQKVENPQKGETYILDGQKIQFR